MGALAYVLSAPGVPAPAPEFTFHSFDGQAFALRDLRGRAVVLNFWASWCGPCLVELPELVKAQQQADPRTQFLGVVVDDGEPQARALITQFRVRYPNGPARSGDASGQDMSRLFGVQSLPATVIIAPDGLIHATFTRPLAAPELVAQIAAAYRTPSTGQRP